MYLVACRICLSTRCKLLPLVNSNMVEAYCEVTGLSCSDSLPQALCAECAALVTKFQRFRQKSQCAHDVLTDILLNSHVITQSHIESINRHNLKLSSNLKSKYNPPNYYDADVTYIDDQVPTLEENGIKNEINTFSDGFNVFIDDDSNHYTEDIVDPILAVDVSLKDEPVKDEVNLKSEPKPNKTNSSDSEDDKPLRQRWKKKRKTVTKNTDGPNIKDHFVIKKLNAEEQKIELDKRKTSVNYLKSKFRCEFCYRGFQEQRTFDEHMLKHNKEAGPFACAVCSRYFPSSYLLRRHRADHETLYTCKQCAFTTHFLHYTKLHVNWHKGTTYSCSQCTDVFNRHSSLLTHRRIKHPTEHVCVYCGYSFLGEKGIYQHQRLRHKGEDTEIASDASHCRECDIRFASDAALRTHARVSPRHAAPDRLVRNVRPQGKVKRVKKERGDKQKPLQCEQCQMPMKTYSAYRFHFQREHPNMTLARTKPCEHLCDVCGKQFSCAANLADHQTEHLDSCLFECTECDKRYKRLSSLKLHQKVHSGRRHACPVCAKTFNQPTNRDRHLAQVHSDEKKVACLLCDKRFKSHGERKNHTQHVHLDKPWPRRRRQTKRRQDDMFLGTSTVDTALIAPMQ